MTYLNIPRLRLDAAGAGGVTITEHGKFETRDINNMGEIAKKIDVLVNNAQVVRSVPNIWARPAMYEAILNNRENSIVLYEKLVAEWRGVLAMLALREVRGITGIDVLSCVIPSSDVIVENTPNFIKVVEKNFPSKLEEYFDGEKKVQIITRNGQPLAFVWPGLLICPACDYELAMAANSEEVSWYNNAEKRFDDVSEKLTPEEKNIVCRWLTMLEETSGVVNDDYLHMVNGATGLANLITDFKDSLTGGVFSEGLEFSDNEICIEGAYSGLGRCYRVNPNLVPLGAATSDVLLDSDNPRKILVLIDGLERQFNRNANEVRVLGPIMFNSVMGICTLGSVRDNSLPSVDMEAINAEVWSTDDFFSDRIVVAFNFNNNLVANCSGAGCFRHNNNVQGVMPILPIRKKVLDYLSESNIVDKIQFGSPTFTTDAEIRTIEVSLKVNLKTSTGVREITIKKIYSSGEIIELDQGLPTIQIWPNFKSKAWKTYYVFCSESCSRNDSRKFTFSPIVDEVLETQEISKEWQQKTLICETKRVGVPPKAFSCMTYERVPKEVGIIVVDDSGFSKIPLSSNWFNIGIDFGTTNTVAYMRKDGDVRQQITFEDRLYPVIGASGGIKENLRRYFIPNLQSSNDGVVRTVFHKFDNGVINKNPFRRGNIYYVDESIVNIHNDTSLIKELNNNLKWATTGDKDDTVGYLAQYCLQCLAEVAAFGADVQNKIKWNYSYPSTYTVSEINSFKMLLQNVICNIVHGVTGCNTVINTGVAECIAAAEFFQNSGLAPVTRGFVSFDIGGGSTDIAVWQGDIGENIRRYQASFRFAGNDIVGAYIQRKATLLRSLIDDNTEDNINFNNMIESMISTVKTNNNDRVVAGADSNGNVGFFVQLEALLKNHGQKFNNRLRDANLDGDILIMLRDVTFAISGMFYYMGVIIKHLRKTNKYGHQELQPNCCVGGNGSKILNWVESGEYTMDLLIECFGAGIGDEYKVGESWKNYNLPMVIRSGLPKHEVACGLVSDGFISAVLGDNNDNTDVPEVDTSIVCGEFIQVDSKQYVPTDLITRTDLFNAKGVINFNQNNLEFKKFVGVFNDYIHRNFGKPGISMEQLNVILASVKQDMQKNYLECNRDENNMKLEPIFIMLLKKTLEHM